MFHIRKLISFFDKIIYERFENTYFRMVKLNETRPNAFVVSAVATLTTGGAKTVRLICPIG